MKSQSRPNYVPESWLSISQMGLPHFHSFPPPLHLISVKSGFLIDFRFQCQISKKGFSPMAIFLRWEKQKKFAHAKTKPSNRHETTFNNTLKTGGRKKNFSLPPSDLRVSLQCFLNERFRESRWRCLRETYLHHGQSGDSGAGPGGRCGGGRGRGLPRVLKPVHLLMRRLSGKTW